MPYSNFTDLKTRSKNPSQTHAFVISAFTSLAFTGRPVDGYRFQNPAPTNPTTSVALTNSDAALVNLVQDGPVYPVSTELGPAPGVYILCDRLVHNGGMTTGFTTASTLNANLPTAALPRYTDGTGVMMGLSIYSTIGSTPATVSATYTDETGTSRTSPAQIWGGNGHRENGRMLILPWHPSSKGTRSVEGLSATGNTGAAGLFGVVLFKPLATFVVTAASGVSILDAATGGLVGKIEEVSQSAHLFLLAIPLTVGGTSFVNGTISFAKVT